MAATSETLEAIGSMQAGLGSTLSYQLPCQQPIRVLHLTADIEII